ncbi:MAG: flagellar filament capping protein FliD [Bdellovibrionota bacterium]
MGLRFDPVGGGQFKQIVKQIIDAESQPIKTLEARKAREEIKLKLFQEFKSKFSSIEKALGEVSSFNKFRELQVDLGEGNQLMSVTLEKDKAQPGVYTLQVEDLAARTSVISNGFDDQEESSLGVGFIIMYLPNGESAEVFVDEENASLRGIAQLVNQEIDCPVRASVIRDASEPDTPWKLILTAKKDGEERQIYFPEFYFLDGSKDLHIDDYRDARNALVEVDGFPIELESNDVIDFLPGINIHLKQSQPGKLFTMSISEDHQKMAGKMKGLVDQLNQVLQFIIQQNAVNEQSDTRNTFAGDASLQGIEYRLRNLMHEGFPAGDPDSDEFRLFFLSQLGVEFSKNGLLTFKEDRFAKELEKDFDGVAEAIGGDFGFAFQLKEVLNAYTRSNDGFLSVRERGMRSRINDIDKRIEDKTRMLDRRQQSLTDQFARLQSTLSNLQRQQQYISGALPSAPGGNLIQQLLGA